MQNKTAPEDAVFLQTDVFFHPRVTCPQTFISQSPVLLATCANDLDWHLSPEVTVSVYATPMAPATVSSNKPKTNTRARAMERSPANQGQPLSGLMIASYTKTVKPCDAERVLPRAALGMLGFLFKFCVGWTAVIGAHATRRGAKALMRESRDVWKDVRVSGVARARARPRSISRPSSYASGRPALCKSSSVRYARDNESS